MDKITHTLKADEGNGKFFKPVIDQSKFITSNTQRPKEEVIQIHNGGIYSHC